jgi:hypothetical protein
VQVFKQVLVARLAVVLEVILQAHLQDKLLLAQKEVRSLEEKDLYLEIYRPMQAHKLQ